VTLLLTRRGDGAIGHWCAGCKGMHYFDDGYIWDGDEEAPTFYPDMFTISFATEDVCHYTIVAGVITYLPRTTHALRGKRLRLEPPPSDDPPSIETAMHAIAAAMRSMTP
jgi:hypothetical protein